MLGSSHHDLKIVVSDHSSSLSAAWYQQVNLGTHQHVVVQVG
jgi:hypothetical protein